MPSTGIPQDILDDMMSRGIEKDAIYSIANMAVNAMKNVAAANSGVISPFELKVGKKPMNSTSTAAEISPTDWWIEQERHTIKAAELFGQIQAWQTKTREEIAKHDAEEERQKNDPLYGAFA